MLPEITKYDFGIMKIGSKNLTGDLMILADGRIIEHWRRAAGHQLTSEDICPLIADVPEILIVGTGASGFMKIDPDLLKTAAGQGIDITALPTRQATEHYNQLRYQNKKFNACFHLTC